MTSMIQDAGDINPNELWQQLQALEDGSIEADSRDELMKLVAESETAQRLYLEYFELSSILQSEASTQDEQGKLPPVAKANLQGPVFRRSILTAAAILALFAAIMSIVMIQRPDAALVNATAGARWSVDGVSSEQDGETTRLEAGSRIRLESGTMEVTIPSGVRMVMQGPATVAFPELDKPSLLSGWIWIDSEESDSPFELNTPALLVRDIGTRFGVRVLKSGETEIHLVEGKLELFEKSTGDLLRTLEPEGRGMAVSSTAEQRPIDLARDPFPDLKSLLEAPENYPTTVRSQYPSGYWRGGDKDGIFRNEVPKGVNGRSQPWLRSDVKGPGGEGDFSGFEANNRAVQFTENSKGVKLSLGVSPVHSGVLFQDDFSGGPDKLNGASPDVTTDGASWMASPIFKADGSITPAEGSATLAFTPVEGVVYTLDASIITESGASEDWIALGFSDGQAVDKSRFVSGSVFGRTWMLHRAADSTETVNRTWVGSIGRDWSWSGDSPLGGALDLRIVLDTTEGAGRWKSTWYAKRPDQADFQLVGDTMPLHNESISSVGFAISGSEVAGSLESISLQATPRTAGRPLTYLADGPAKLNRKEGAISCWVRRAPNRDDRQILWTAGEDPFNTSAQLRLEADGKVGFFMENGRYDVLIRSEKPISESGWHHIVACWDSSSVNLYLDGKSVARDRHFRGLQKGELSELSFGGGFGKPESPGYSGRVDEIAVWDHALTHTEVLHQFRSALGK